MDAVLEPGHLRHELIAFSDTSPQGFGRLVWDPHFGKKPAGMEFGKHAGVDFVRFYLGAFPDGQSALNLAAARLRHIAGTAWSTTRYLNIELLKDQEMRDAITARASAGRRSAKPNVRKTPDMCGRPPGARRIFWNASARGRVPTCVRP
jgi:hypothetical protein